jgi:pyrroloquinoline quinone biosynthesis protein B
MIVLLPVYFFLSCSSVPEELPNQYFVIGGIAQDAGYPQIGCTKDCCNAVYAKNESMRLVTSLAFVDRQMNRFWLFDATPDIGKQLVQLQKKLPSKNFQPSGVFLTHAHIGHYTGLMYFGREAMNTQAVPVYTLPRMKQYLTSNGPWSQLAVLQNIQLQELVADSSVPINDGLTITPFLVPHRDEYAETAGFLIESRKRKALFIPDIDKWNKWNRNLEAEIRKVDRVFIDGTFYQDGELPGRNMNEVPHPFVTETMVLLKNLPLVEKDKVWFIHFNHTNPLLRETGTARREVEAKGFHVAKEGMVVSMDE